MGSGSSINSQDLPTTVEEALKQGYSMEQINEYKQSQTKSIHEDFASRIEKEDEELATQKHLSKHRMEFRLRKRREREQKLKAAYQKRLKSLYTSLCDHVLEKMPSCEFITCDKLLQCFSGM